MNLTCNSLGRRTSEVKFQSDNLCFALLFISVFAPYLSYRIMVTVKYEDMSDVTLWLQLLNP